MRRRSIVEVVGLGVLGLGAALASVAFAQDKPKAGDGAKVPFREYPIGDEVEREVEHLRVAAVWLPPVTMDHEHGHATGPHVVHLECDIHATRGNENGFAVGDWIPYLTIKYRIEPADKAAETAAAGAKVEGTLMPMVAKDGPHY